MAKFSYKKLTILALSIFFLLFFSICLWKYSNLQYNELDLAIIEQTFQNTTKGEFLKNSIQGNLYFADHFAPIFFLLLPFYVIFQSPILLLLAQILSLTIAGWILFKITLNLLNSEKLAFFVTLAYIFNFSIQGMSLFGFHFLPSSILLIFLIYYFYLKHNYKWYVITLLTSLLIREDVSLIILMWSIIPLIEKRSKKWWLLPLISGSIYFYTAIKITSTINPNQNYKFLIYYNWLGNSFTEIITTFFTKPIYTLSNSLFRMSTFELFIKLLLPTGFIALLGWKYLLPTTIILATYILQGNLDGSLVTQAHYAALFIPFLFIALINGLYKLTNIQYKKYAIYYILCISVLTSLTWGPLITFGQSLNSTTSDTTVIKKYISELPKESHIIASSNLLPILTNHTNLYSLHYIFWGNQQFSQKNYTTSQSIDYLIINIDEFKIFHYQYNQLPQFFSSYKTGYKHIQKIIQQHNLSIEKYIGNYLVFSNKNNYPQNFISKIEHYPSNDAQKLNEYFTLLNVTIGNQNNILNNFIPIDLVFKNHKTLHETTYIQFKYDSNIIEYPIGLGILPSFSWNENDIISIRYWLPQSAIRKPIDLGVFTQSGIGYFNKVGTATTKTIIKKKL